jgi:hypothetical protein
MVDLEAAEKTFLDDEKLARVQELCLCPGCPAYPEADRGEKKAYCLRGDSAHKAQIVPSDCYCESCEIYKHGKLYGSNFFCLEGAALAKGLRNVLSGNVITGLVDDKLEPCRPPLVITSGLDVHE